MSRGLPRVQGIQHRFVDAGGIRIHVAEAGPDGPTRPPVLLLHGWPQHWYMWRRVIRGLEGEFHLLAPDLRGFGWTDAPGHGYDGETFAADQVALLDALGIERAFVIGHDWGGWAGILLGLLHPERLERLIVCSAPHPWPRVGLRVAAEAWRSWYTWVLATPRLGPRSLRHGWITRNILSGGNVGAPFSAAEIDAYVESFREPSRADAVSHLYRYYQRAARDGLARRWRDHRLTVPTVIVFGQGDRYLSPKLLPGFEPHADDMRVELVSACGHFVVDEKPDLIAARARSFFA